MLNRVLTVAIQQHFKTGQGKHQQNVIEANDYSCTRMQNQAPRLPSSSILSQQE